MGKWMPLGLSVCGKELSFFFFVGEHFDFSIGSSLTVELLKVFQKRRSRSAQINLAAANVD